MARSKRLTAALDFETDPFEYGRIPEPFAGGLAIDGGEYISFWGDNCADEMAECVADMKLRVYAHNGGKFDYFFMLNHLDPTLSLINGRIAKAKLGESQLYDSYLILPIPLSGMDKLEIDYKIMERGVRELGHNRREIMKYLRADCEFLLEWVLKFNERFGKKLTVAAAAFAELEATGYPCKNKSNENYDQTVRPYYFGGRTQAFKTGVFKGDYKVYDINSAYPAAMMEDHPFGTDYVRTNSLKVKDLLTTPGLYFAKILAVSSGCLPVRIEGETSLQYPTDDVEREYCVSVWEIRAGLETNSLKVIRVLEGLIWSETENFKNYVDKFFAEKSEGKKSGDKSATLFAKLMLNSAYGKFGADGRKYKKWYLAEDEELPISEADDELRKENEMGIEEFMEMEQWKEECTLECGKVLWSKPDPVKDFYNVAVAASITGWVRAKMWRSIRNSTDVLYCDTDSLICTGFGGGEIDAYKLGEWDMEGVSRGTVWIGGRKLYTLEIDEKDDKGKWKVKKAHKGARLTHEEIVRIVEKGETVEWRNMAPSFSLTRPTAFVKRDIKSNKGDA